jgi:anti-sigma-K factor RskA
VDAPRRVLARLGGGSDAGVGAGRRFADTAAGARHAAGSGNRATGRQGNHVGRTLELRAARPTTAEPAKSYELWLLPAEGGAISLAVLNSLDARFALPPGQVERLRTGAKLAVTLEPAGGSPEGKATGPVILIGEIKV